MKHEHPKIIRAKKKLDNIMMEKAKEHAAKTIRDEIDSELIEQLRKIASEQKTINA